MRQSRKSYSREFKIAAVWLLHKGGKGLAQTAEDLGVNRTMLSRWRKEVGENSNGAFPGSGRMEVGGMELRDLQEQIEQLREELDILKKAADFFRTRKD